LQSWPQNPQLQLSLLRSVQKAPVAGSHPEGPEFCPLGGTQQAFSPHEMSHRHTPSAQISPDGQTLPHPPQFMLSVDVFTHVGGQQTGLAPIGSHPPHPSAALKSPTQEPP
jgi:hypothetical protein